MDSFEIEQNVEVPGKGRYTGGRPMKYPWRDMEVGDSIVADGTSASTSKCNAYNSAKAWGRSNGASFTGRYVGNGKVRIWRVE